MIQYKLNEPQGNYAQKIVDGSETGEWVNIQSNPEYLAWLAEGNEPLPADEPQQGQ